MSTIITDEIVKDIGEAWRTLKVDGTKDPTDPTIVLHYVETSNTVTEGLASMTPIKQCDAMSPTQLVFDTVEKHWAKYSESAQSVLRRSKWHVWSTRRNVKNRAGRMGEKDCCREGPHQEVNWRVERDVDKKIQHIFKGAAALLRVRNIFCNHISDVIVSGIMNPALLYVAVG
ncbi:unnamed protein product [Lepeophtheirus salmonis]|uniref:(salmon louse) hypothetical protein n=1 Tax=Lepeophtheirus salmonis TaxID=72036 RepID=A0A7R8H8A7_LEPSM|nr:unnamed protein product [Lepeophtheirus salmonis]CAF2934959.1 unnamed protein product [Lepeophtheirus salmonis]